MTRFSLLPFALLAPALTLALVSCKSSPPKGVPKNLPRINVSSSAAPPKHNMNRGEYPFDARGNYVAAWAAEGSRGGGNVPAPQPRYEEPEPEPEPAYTAPVSRSTKSQKAPSSTRMVVSTTPAPPSTRSAPPPTVRVSPPSSSSSSSSRATVASTPKPAPKPAPKPTPKPKPKPTSSTVVHTVKSGDTLYGLALRYKSTVAKIKSASGISSDLLRIGQKLKIPR